MNNLLSRLKTNRSKLTNQSQTTNHQIRSIDHVMQCYNFKKLFMVICKAANYGHGTAQPIYIYI